MFSVENYVFKELFEPFLCLWTLPHGGFGVTQKLLIVGTRDSVQRSFRSATEFHTWLLRVYGRTLMACRKRQYVL